MSAHLHYSTTPVLGAVRRDDDACDLHWTCPCGHRWTEESVSLRWVERHYPEIVWPAPQARPDPRLDPSTRYGRIWERLCARHQRRLDALRAVPYQSVEWQRRNDLAFESLHDGGRFLQAYKLGVYSERPNGGNG